MSDICQLFIETANTFRIGQEVKASEMFGKCIDQLQLALQKPSLAKQLMPLMPMLLNAQENRDWLGLADTIEYEVLPIFSKV
ncbi:hypothetical protein [Shewanella dokdonensis]|uniref:Uncharacterized protein n=1 Tax=Shewanella dokdonensis TaxID=712036 RepID=A0ABX8DG69_9GAMM|nr:hypothetical protein [Shewanella dokdonensis]MCL1073979.1 hypothetical protein [Shewanella dokdonensis]QVK23738.1 hypothetical protein KHX94_03285 [Shewanella dokdonensis]